LAPHHFLVLALRLSFPAGFLFVMRTKHLAKNRQGYLGPERDLPRLKGV
jgi:hypothetical protein